MKSFLLSVFNLKKPIIWMVIIVTVFSIKSDILLTKDLLISVKKLINYTVTK